MEKTKKFEWKKHLMPLGMLSIFVVFLLISSYEKLVNAREVDPYILMCIGIMCTLAILVYATYYCLFIKKIAFEKCYLLVGIVMGIIFMFVIPLYNTPDENAHIGFAYHVSNAILGYDKEIEGVPYALRECELNAEVSGVVSQFASRTTYNNVLFNLFKVEGAEGNAVYAAPERAASTYLLHVIPGIGVTIGRLLSWGVVPTLLLGTLFNMLFFVGSAYYAMKKIPFGKMMLASVCLLPMSLQQISSYSYDNTLLAAIMVVFALGLRWGFSSEKIKKSEVAIYCVYSIILVIGKSAVYSFFCLLPIVYKISKDKVQEIWKKYKKFIILICAIGCLVAIILIPIILSILGGTPMEVTAEDGTIIVYENYIQWANEEGYTIKGLLMHPREAFNVLVNTLIVKGDFYLLSMYGYSLGQFQIGIPLVIIMMYAAIGVLSAICIEGKNVLSVNHKVIMTFLVLVSAGLCVLSMWLYWTPRSYGYIEGVQGRYFLPPYVVALFCIGGENFRLKKNIERELLLCNVLIGTIMVFSILRQF